LDLVRTVAVERAVQRVYLDHCDAIGEKWFDNLDRVFTPDCEGDYRHPQGVALDGLAPLVMRQHENMAPDSTCGGTHHNVLNFRIAVLDDAHTEAQVHFYAVHQGSDAIAVLGFDGVGVVAVVGTDMNDVRMGDRVCVRANQMTGQKGTSRRRSAWRGPIRLPYPSRRR
jgi:hypothetical protein